MTLPCVGAGITVVDPGFNSETAVYGRGRGGFMPSRKPKLVKHRSSRGRLLRAYVTEVEERWPDTPEANALHRASDIGRVVIYWMCGKMANVVYGKDEGVTWIHGHGEQARQALLAARAMAAR